MNRRRLTIAAIFIAWAASAAWLVFYEAYPELRQEVSGGYQSLLARGVMVADEYMKISFQGRQIGYSQSTVDLDESDGRHQYLIGNRTILQLNVMGTRQWISVSTHATVDIHYDLQNFAFVLSSAGYAISVDGERAGPDTFRATVRSAGSTQRFNIAVPPDAVLYSPMTEMALKALAPGKEATLRLFNPVTLAPQSVTVRALRRETIRHRNQDVEATVLATTTDGMETLSWIDRAGRVLRQETPFGWTMEACSASEALNIKGVGVGGDVLTALAVPVTGNTAALATARNARLVLHGATVDAGSLASQRQTVVAVSSNAVTLDVRADALPAPGDRGDSASAADLAPFLASTPFVQAADPTLIAQAKAITSACTNRIEAAVTIYTWVNQNVVKKPSPSLPSALDVLRQREGDCNEHTYLFVGLARAAGLPAKIRVGLTLNDGLLYYHAWPSVYVGRWVDMDPTLGRPAVSAAYLSLLEGELAEQMKLMGMIGKLKVEIVATEP